ncbi:MULTISPECIES: hypothetical protein [Pseudoalteromonas]|nr:MULTISPECIES: hypothetical protein [Pseudoalteromonas]MDQ2046122.1 hypothetical protein [Pseudoalteromonas sp. 20-92]
MNVKKDIKKIEKKFIPHEVSLERVKNSFERSKKKQKEDGFNSFVEVK